MIYLDGRNLAVNSGATASLSTQTLTVWRKLYLERDRLDNVNFQEPGKDYVAWHSIQGGEITGRFSNRSFRTSLAAIFRDQWDWEGKFKFFERTGWFWNYHYAPLDDGSNAFLFHHNSGSDVNLVVKSDVPARANYVFVADDDVAEFDIAANGAISSYAPKIQPTRPNGWMLDLLNHHDNFPAACIVVDFDALVVYNDHNVNPFRLHAWAGDDPLGKGKSEAKYDYIIESGMDQQGGVLFWTANVSTAYQESVTVSRDGTAETSCGISAPFWANSAAVGGALIFIETIRDMAHEEGVSSQEQAKRSLAHEIGHLMGGSHGDRGLMAQSVVGGGDVLFTGNSLLKFMLLQDAGPGKHNPANGRALEEIVIVPNQ